MSRMLGSLRSPATAGSGHAGNGARRTKEQSERAAVILAGGEGTRLRRLTRELYGEEIPKQFCRLLGDATLLEQTRRRTRLLVPPERTMTVLTAAHARFFEPLLAEMEGEHTVVQPYSRGTAAAILYALMRLKQIAPDCSVAMFPSDHFVSDDEEFMRHVEAAFWAVDARPEATVLLGIEPSGAEPQYGWIEPGRLLTNECVPVRHVQRFWEKPRSELACQLLHDGCLWNSFVMVARLSTLLGLFLIALPELYKAFNEIESSLGTPAEKQRVQRLYSRVSAANFSSEVLATCPFNLAVLPVAGVQWVDLGEAGRLMSLLAEHGVEVPYIPGPLERTASLNGGDESAGDL
jgi:mannose-1-phosphate guanylyltransferase